MAKKQKCMTSKHAKQMQTFIIERMHEILFELGNGLRPERGWDIELCQGDKILASIEVEIQVPRKGKCFNPDSDMYFVKTGCRYDGVPQYVGYTDD